MKKKKGPAVAGQLWLSGEVTGPLRATLLSTRVPKKLAGWLEVHPPRMHHSFAVTLVPSAFPFALGGVEGQLRVRGAKGPPSCCSRGGSWFGDSRWRFQLHDAGGGQRMP